MKNDPTKYCAGAMVRLSALCIGGIVSADSSILGDVDISADVGKISSAAIGGGNQSIIDIATIGSANIGGDAELNVQQKNIVGAAIGSNSVNEISVGSVKDSHTGKVIIDVLTGKVLTMALGNGKTGRTKIGTVTDATTGSIDINISTGSIVNINGEVLIGAMGEKE